MSQIEIPDSLTPTKVFSAYLEWDHDDLDVGTEIFRAISRFKCDGLRVGDCSVGACWNHNLTVLGPTEKSVSIFVGKVLRLLKRKKAKLYALQGVL